MILLPCPWCGSRDAGEFSYGGELRERPDPRTATREQWRGYLYLRANTAGWTTERWHHRMGCRRYLTVRRNTVTNEVEPLSEPGRQL